MDFKLHSNIILIKIENFFNFIIGYYYFYNYYSNFKFSDKYATVACRWTETWMIIFSFSPAWALAIKNIYLWSGRWRAKDVIDDVRGGQPDPHRRIYDASFIDHTSNWRLTARSLIFLPHFECSEWMMIVALLNTHVNLWRQECLEHRTAFKLTRLFPDEPIPDPMCGTPSPACLICMRRLAVSQHLDHRLPPQPELLLLFPRPSLGRFCFLFRSRCYYSQWYLPI